jgi:hypothetical protein
VCIVHLCAVCEFVYTCMSLCMCVSVNISVVSLCAVCVYMY